MREYLFRGKRKDNQIWAEGYYLCLHSEEEDLLIIVDHEGQYHRVDPETVGQYTGVNVGADKLFEGDIVEWHEDYDDTWGYTQTAHGRSVVIWDKENFCWAFETDKKYVQPFNDWSWNSCYVIGNIHDNHELLGGGNEE